LSKKHHLYEAYYIIASNVFELHPGQPVTYLMYKYQYQQHLQTYRHMFRLQSYNTSWLCTSHHL